MARHGFMADVHSAACSLRAKGPIAARPAARSDFAVGTGICPSRSLSRSKAPFHHRVAGHIAAIHVRELRAFGAASVVRMRATRVECAA